LGRSAQLRATPSDFLFVRRASTLSGQNEQKRGAEKGGQELGEGMGSGARESFFPTNEKTCAEVFEKGESEGKRRQIRDLMNGKENLKRPGYLFAWKGDFKERGKGKRKKGEEKSSREYECGEGGTNLNVVLREAEEAFYSVEQGSGGGIRQTYRGERGEENESVLFLKVRGGVGTNDSNSKKGRGEYCKGSPGGTPQDDIYRGV